MNALNEVDVISVRKIEGAGNLKAFVDIRIGGCLVIRGCSVISKGGVLTASLPRQVGLDGSWRDVVIVADDQLKKNYLDAILKGYKANED